MPASVSMSQSTSAVIARAFFALASKPIQPKDGSDSSTAHTQRKAEVAAAVIAAAKNAFTQIVSTVGVWLRQ